MNKTQTSIELEKRHLDMVISKATYDAFGELPIDKKYLPVMRAWAKGHAAEQVEKVLMGLIGDIASGRSSALVDAINSNRQVLADAISEYRRAAAKGDNRDQ